MNYSIEKMQPMDWGQVADIYLSGIKTGVATLQSKVPNWEEWSKEHSEACRYVARSGDTILGWTALTPVSGRCVYAGVAEVSIYINEDFRNKGVGTALLTELIRGSEAAGYWTLQASINQKNTPSQGLFMKCGFREIGIREKIGQTPDGKWQDIILVEKRSRTVGI